MMKHALTTPPGCLELGPDDIRDATGVLAWKDMNMKAVATTQYASGLLDLQGHDEIGVALRTVPTGTPTTGQVKLILERYDQTGTILLQRLDLVTLINTFLSTAAVHFFLRIGGGRVAGRTNTGPTGTPAAAQGTISADAESFGALAKTQFIWETTTAGNGTTQVANGYIFAKAV